MVTLRPSTIDGYKFAPSNKSTGDDTSKYGSANAKLLKRSLMVFGNDLCSRSVVMTGKPHAFTDKIGSVANRG